ncbi:uncharacterized protein F4822DRAFT_323886 [Hypoxylon trugodes]|uniref:uncharacterized protein n=1 Tax=Hypoxylon trugodes TaxID=326681 RepID=UPI00219AD558|nr:uncharacterized protein F4822DRAFT_323886 [Hypoxylon trugodes]KAI1386675.1 hypothetical protein F4822DRAFT_323886 [Hypoxylon trugodes]
MNFHKPLPQDHVAYGWACWLDTEEITVQDQHMTWLACFSISTQAAVYQGVLPPLSPFHQLKYVKNAIRQLGPILQPEHQASLAIYECVCNYSIALEDTEDLAAHLPLVQTFEAALDSIEQIYSTHSMPELNILLQYAKLNLYAMVVLEGSQAGSQVDEQSVLNKRALLLRGLESASRVIYQMKELSLLPVENGVSNAGKLTFYPRQYITNMFFAAIYLFRMLVDCRPIGQMHVTLALGSIAEARDIFRLMPHNRAALMGADFLSRVVDKAHAIDASSSVLSLPQLLITNRLGASLLYDIIFRMRFFARKESNGHLAVQSQERVDNGLQSDVLAPEARPQPPDIQQEPLDTSLVQHSGENVWFSWDTFSGSVGIDFDLYSYNWTG